MLSGVATYFRIRPSFDRVRYYAEQPQPPLFCQKVEAQTYTSLYKIVTPNRSQIRQYKHSKHTSAARPRTYLMNKVPKQHMHCHFSVLTPVLALFTSMAPCYALNIGFTTTAIMACRGLHPPLHIHRAGF